MHPPHRHGRSPRQAESLSDADQRKLYDLIWKRTIASQMEAARLERTTVEIGSRTGRWACAPQVRCAVRRLPEGL
jgi:DNA topoisomerase IA